jgi:hypothetical protein
MAQRGANGPPVTISAGSPAALKLQGVIEAKLVAFLGSYTGENMGYTPSDRRQLCVVPVTK